MAVQTLFRVGDMVSPKGDKRVGVICELDGNRVRVKWDKNRTWFEWTRLVMVTPGDEPDPVTIVDEPEPIALAVGDRVVVRFPKELGTEVGEILGIESGYAKVKFGKGTPLVSLKSLVKAPPVVEIPTVDVVEIPTVEESPVVEIPTAPTVHTDWIPLKAIGSEGTQSRCRLDQQTVEEYRCLMVTEMWRWEMSPIVVFTSGDGKYLLGDGFHRLTAAKSAKFEEIFAEIHYSDDPERSALFHSVGANKYHGLPRNNKDKERCVILVLGDDEWSKMSNRAIAEHCGVSAPLVGRVRRDLESDGTIAPVTERKTKNGKTLETAKIGKEPKKSRPDPVVVEPIPDQTFPLHCQAIQECVDPVESTRPVVIEPVADPLPILEYLENNPTVEKLKAIPQLHPTPSMIDPQEESELDWEVLIHSIESMKADDLIGLAKTCIDRCFRYGYVDSVTELLPPLVQPAVVIPIPSPSPLPENKICFDCGIDLEDSIVYQGAELCDSCYEDRVNKKCYACGISGVSLLAGSLGRLCRDCYDDIEADL